VLPSRKGGWRLAIEKRAGGKAVTVLSGVDGDAGTLLKALRKHCGAGGAVAASDAVEIQGDHRAAIAAWLEARGGRG
jgi:translation initiation factor 1 (eIF-1/SUI1)